MCGDVVRLQGLGRKEEEGSLEGREGTFYPLSRVYEETKGGVVSK